MVLAPPARLGFGGVQPGFLGLLDLCNFMVVNNNLNNAVAKFVDLAAHDFKPVRKDGRFGRGGKIFRRHFKPYGINQQSKHTNKVGFKRKQNFSEFTYLANFSFLALVQVAVTRAEMASMEQ